MHAIIHIQKMNLNTVKWAQWNKNQSSELLGLFICVCFALCTIVAHNIAQNRHFTILSRQSPLLRWCLFEVSTYYCNYAVSGRQHQGNSQRRQKAFECVWRDIFFLNIWKCSVAVFSTAETKLRCSGDVCIPDNRIHPRNADRPQP